MKTIDPNTKNALSKHGYRQASPQRGLAWWRGALTVALMLVAAIPAFAQDAPKEESIRERFGARDPQTCEDTKAPAKGAITAALAKKYFICQAEGVSGGYLYLVEDVKLEVGGPVPYTPNLGAFEAIDVNVPLYPIRGSYSSYQCRDLIREYVGPPGKNANLYKNPKAKGYCYKTTFGDWKCFMADPNQTDKENVTRFVTPPQ